MEKLSSYVCEVSVPVPFLIGEFIFVLSCLHVLELLERAALEDIELVLLLPESKRIVAIPETSKSLFTGKSAFLVDTWSVDEAVKVSLVGSSDAGHQEGEADNLQLVPLGLILNIFLDSSGLELQALHHVFHGKGFYLI